MQHFNLAQHNLRNILPAGFISEQWAPAAFDDTPETYIHDLARARVSLAEAERIIRAQEAHIRNLEDMALTDELTGLLNRRGFILSLQRELSLARRAGSVGGTLVMIDLDGFKSINDLWGHGIGDDYLQAVAHALLSSVRAGDIVARLGGDEFAILFVNMDKEMGMKRVVRLEESFNSRLIDCGNQTLPLRASFGLSCYSGEDTPEDILDAADQKLYGHKAARKQLALALV